MENLTYTSKEAARPLVSIIVRTKDRPKRLTNALNSIARQDYPNIEVVVVNDGGQDVTPIVEDCLKNFSFNYVFLENSRGRAGAANAGLNAANGDYLNFLDDDDALYPDHIASLVSCILETGCSVAYSNILSVYFDGAPETPETAETPGNRVKEEEVFNRAFDPIRLLVENYLPIMSVLFSKAVLLEAAGFCEALDLFEDWDFWIRVSQHFHFCHLDKTTGEYRIYENDSMEGLHRRKYSYDESRAKVYDRVLPLLDGKRLVSAFNLFHRAGQHRRVNRSVDRMRERSGRAAQGYPAAGKTTASQWRGDRTGLTRCKCAGCIYYHTHAKRGGGFQGVS